MQGTETIELTLPGAALGYLRFLAANTMLGATPNVVASLILGNELTRMAQTGFHNVAIPRA